MSTKSAFLLLATTLLAGCVNVPGGLLPNSGEFANGNAELRIQPQILAGGLMTQAVVDNYTSSSINHMVVKLFKVNGSESPVLDSNSNPLTKDVPNAELSSVVTFGNLNANTTYRIRAYAYQAAGTDEANLISTSDVSSYTDVTLTNNDRPTLTSLRVKLIDKVFNGQATASGVVVTNGGLVTNGPETIN